MTKEETIKITDKIKIYRPKFEVTQNVIEEYFKVFEPYDYEDVEQKLNNYLSDMSNQNRYPDPIYLTKYLRTSYDKEHTHEPKITCSYCLKPIRHLEYKAHVDRCSSVCWLCDMSKHYFLKKLDRKKLFELDQNTFDQKYYEFSKLLLPKLPQGSAQYKALENVIKSYEGVPVGWTLEEINEALEQ